MASDEIKERIEHYFNCTNVPTTMKDWKRVAKGKLPNGEIYREFENKILGRTVYTLGDDEDCSILEKDVWLYGVYNIKPGEEMFPGFGSMSIVFEPQDRWKRQGFIYDQHQQYLLEAFFPGFPKIDEDQENEFSYEDSKYSDLTIHMALKKAGFTFSQEITDFLNSHNSPGAMPPTAPTNPPTPPALVPVISSNVPPAKPLTHVTSNQIPVVAPVPAATPPSNTGVLGGYFGTGLVDDNSAKPSDFIAAVIEDDGDVLVMITPMMAFARGDSFDQSVGPLVDHLLPADWYETSEQTYTPNELSMPEAFDFLLQSGFNVDWKEYKDEFKGSYDVYDVTREQHKSNMDLIANPVSIMPQHHVNPIPVTAPAPNTTGYPELAGQEPAVQAALVGARVRGVLGLEQENGKWDDVDLIEQKWDNGAYQQFDNVIELERSHALWLLYEHYDQGSGLAFPNFFGMDNVRVGQELEKILPIDLEDADDEPGEIEITDDSQPYPAPYDLPVPAYVAPAPIVQAPVIQTSKPQPKASKPVARGPSQGKMTGSGSFTPVAGTPAPVADEDETLMDAHRVEFDSGEQWPEFCGAVWDHYVKHGPGPVEWWDRFRPRHAQIIGLGYKFDRVEFTGIRVQMGYLGKDFKIIDNIDIPGAVFDELFANGGEWNDDDNIQEINKQPGVNEDGFSYSSQDMWATVEPMLRAKGWLPAK